MQCEGELRFFFFLFKMLVFSRDARHGTFQDSAVYNALSSKMKLTYATSLFQNL